MESPETPAVLTRNLSHRYGPFRALTGIDLTLERGDFLTIFGPNGAGKTTLLKIVASLIKPSSGSLSIFGMDPREDPDRVKRRVGLIAHSGFLSGGLSARDNLRFYARLYDVPDATRRVEASLAEVGLSDRSGDLVRTYSRGMQQRLAIARALIHDPELVLLDEPYTGLDQHAARTLRGILEQVRGRGRSVMMVTHSLEEGLEVSTRIAIMRAGRIAIESTTESLTRDRLERLYLDVVGGTAA